MTPTWIQGINCDSDCDCSCEIGSEYLGGKCEDAVVKPAGCKMVDMKGVKESMWYEGQDATLL